MFNKVKQLWSRIVPVLKLKRTWALLIVAGIVAVAFSNGGPAPVVLTTEEVRAGELIQTVDASGTLRSTRETRLSFETTGIVGSVSAKVGDRVRAGALLASLRTADQYAASQEAAAAVRIADASVSAAQVSVENAERAITRAKEEGAQNIAEARAALRSSLASGLITVRTSVSKADEILGVDSDFTNVDYRNVLSSLDTNALIEAEKAYALAKDSLVAAETPVFALSASSSVETVAVAEELAVRALSDASLLLLRTHRVLEATSVTTDTFTAADLTALKSAFNTTRVSAQSAQDAVRTARQNVDAAILAAAQAEDAAIASRNTSAASVTVQIQEASRAAAQRVSSDVRLNKTALRSPIAGIVTAVDVDPGELALSGTPVITVQTADGQFEIVAQIAEADVSKVSLGDVADVTFDAFGDRTQFAARVVSIEPAQNLVEGVVFYEAKLALDPVGKEIVLKPGMTADATITTERSMGVLTVPQRAVLLKDGNNIVRVQTGETTFEERAVVTGLRGDGGRVQITDGVTAGEKIVISVK